MIDAEVLIRTSTGTRRVALRTYLDAAAEELAHQAAYGWIKGLRNLPVDGAPFRARFTVRDDSLWWFTEIYLHKEQVILDIYRALAALQTLVARERPLDMRLTSDSPVVRHLGPCVAASHGIGGDARISAALWWTRLARLDLRARALTLSARLAADRYRGTPGPRGETTVAAFIHRAFWRAGGEDGSAESYIGPILEALEQRAGAQRVGLVGVGPSTNFRTARRRTPSRGERSSVTPVERFAPPGALRASQAVWRRRHANFRTLTQAPSLRAAAVIQGIDCWPLIREQLAGVAWLQWPWSVRAMDEAAAALDALRPAAVLTYAEAGGWGRALVLEARRRGIPSIGAQHGFIYRHWLNYRHEPDEMEPGQTPPFPLPTRTLVFDLYAASHLRERGSFPAEAVEVTGSARLDELRRDVEALEPEDTRQFRRQLGLKEGDAVVLITTKEKEARGVLSGFMDAASAVAGAALVIKPHPAETANAYADVLRDRPGIRIAPPELSLAALLSIARAVVTVNSTVALDAAVFDIPTLVIGLPNNLSPFVDAGALAGSPGPAEVTALLNRILYDEKFRQHLAERRRAVFGDRADRGNGRAAAAAADAVLALAHKGHPRVAGSG
jgi:hypothetical protein